jgi:hypothetical protein
MGYNYPKYYNEFVFHYNKHNNPITATHELRSISIELQEQINRIRGVLDFRIEEIARDIDDDLFTKTKEKVADHRVEFSNLVRGIRKSIYSNLEYYSKNWIDSVNEDINDFYTSYIGAEPSKLILTNLKIINGATLKSRIREEQLKAANDVLFRIIDVNYEKPISTWQELTGLQQNEMRLYGAAKKNFESKELRLVEHWGEILIAVNAVIGDKPLEEFITKKGNARSKLYKNVYKKYNLVVESTLRKWLDKSIKKGYLERDLKNLTRV